MPKIATVTGKLAGGKRPARKPGHQPMPLTSTMAPKTTYSRTKTVRKTRRKLEIRRDATGPREPGARASSRPGCGRVHGDVSEERSVPDLNRPELFARTPLAFCRHTVVTYNPLTRDWR